MLFRSGTDAIAQDIRLTLGQRVGWQAAIALADRHRAAGGVQANPDLAGGVFLSATSWLKGSFEGWFSDDEARIPIVSKMNVYVGNVVIELVKWKRPGWVPPRG